MEALRQIGKRNAAARMTCVSGGESEFDVSGSSGGKRRVDENFKSNSKVSGSGRERAGDGTDSPSEGTRSPASHSLGQAGGWHGSYGNKQSGLKGLERQNGKMPMHNDTKDWPIILHTSIAHSSIASVIRSKCDKVRRSESLLEDTLVFPMAKTAFLLVTLTDALISCLIDLATIMPVQKLNCGLTAKIDSFINRHANSYVVLTAGLFTGRDMEAVGLLQRRYLTSPMQDFLLAHNAEEAVQSMLTVSWMQIPPMSFQLSEKFCEVMTELANRQKKLKKKH